MHVVGSTDLPLLSGAALPRRRSRQRASCACGASAEPLLLRTARGEGIDSTCLFLAVSLHSRTRVSHLCVRVCLPIDVERPPVWLMRQAGRYMKEFRACVGSAPVGLLVRALL